MKYALLLLIIAMLMVVAAPSVSAQKLAYNNQNYRAEAVYEKSSVAVREHGVEGLNPSKGKTDVFEGRDQERYDVINPTYIRDYIDTYHNYY